MVNDQSGAGGFKEKVHIWLPALLAMVLVGGILVGLKMSTVNSFSADRGSGTMPFVGGQQGGAVEELIRYIDAKYVDDVDSEALAQKAIERILAELDPHSSFISAEDLRAVNEQMEGNFDGIGIEFMMLDDTIVVVAPLAGGPSEAVGIEAGDKIITVEDSIIAGIDLSNQEIVNKLRGEKGSEVRVGILRGNNKDLLDFTITRDKIPMYSLDIAQMLDEKTGYIKINRFSATTFREFKEGLETLIIDEGMKDLVLDLRHNPGGYLQQATKMLDLLFQEGEQLLVYTEGRSEKRKEYKTSGLSQFDVENVIILINEGSASASEIVAGAIQDQDRGIIIGRRSFGKGLVQQQYPLRSGAAVRLTIARYYTPSGRSIQREYGDETNYDADLTERYNHGEMAVEDSISIADSTRYFTRNGHLVFGGGGIVPDVFVPIDTILLDEQLASWRQYVTGFVFRFAENQDNPFSDQSADEFVNNYNVSVTVFDDFVRYGLAQNEELTVPTSSLIKRELSFFIKARLARKYFGDDSFFAVLNKEDAMVQKALQILKQPDPLASARE